MLVLTVPRGESVALVLPDDRIVWVRVLGDRRLGVEAPADVRILRGDHLPAPQTGGAPCDAPK